MSARILRYAQAVRALRATPVLRSVHARWADRALRSMLALALLLCLGIAPALAADTPQDAQKLTPQGKYLTAEETWLLLKRSGSGVVIVDVRPPEERASVGYPPISVNIPAQVLERVPGSGGFAARMVDNPHFVRQMQQRFKPGDSIVLMCRSGNRSAAAARRLATAGFVNVYNMIDGFEGDVETSPGSPGYGTRSKNGWRNAKLPWKAEAQK